MFLHLFPGHAGEFSSCFHLTYDATTRAPNERPPLNLKTQASYRDSWELVKNRGLLEFRNAYWGSRGRTALKNVLARPPLERFLHFRQTAVQNLFDLSLPDGLFFVREEYRLLADRIRKARAEKTVSEMQGCMLLGQQGAGAWAWSRLFSSQTC